MKIINYIDFKKKIAESLDTVSNTHEPLIVCHKKGKSVVIVDLGEYNSQQETIYLLSNKANRKRLEAALAEIGKCCKTVGKFRNFPTVNSQL